MYFSVDPQYHIKTSEVKRSEILLGKCQFKVVKGSLLNPNSQETEVAIKLIERGKFKEMKKEITSLCTPLLNNENIIKFFGYYYENDYYPLVLELAIADLNIFLEKKNEKFKEHWSKIDCKRILLHTANGILCLHQNQPSIMHLDLKPENILIVDRQGDGNLRACVADFGKSKHAIKTHCAATCSGAVGTRDWYSPEMIDLNEMPRNRNPRFKITVKSDIYQLGLIFGYTLVNREFHTRKDKNKSSGFEIKQNILTCYRVKKFHDEGFNDFTTEFLIRNMIKENPEKRFDAESVIKNPFFWSEDNIESFFLQIIADHKGHSRNPKQSELIDFRAKSKVFNGFSWMQIINDSEIENEKNKFQKTSKLDENSFLDLLDFIIQVVSFKIRAEL